MVVPLMLALCYEFELSYYCDVFSVRTCFAMSWRKHCMWLCVQRQDKDEAVTLDYGHSSLDNVPSDVFAHERTLEELTLVSNQIRDLPRVGLVTFSYVSNVICCYY